MKAILLAAGFATRMFPLTRDRAKPLLEVAGRPVLSHILERVRALPEVDEVLVVTNGKFEADFHAWAKALPDGAPVRILGDGSTDDTNKLGAIGDIRLVLEDLERRGDSDAPWMVVAGDNLFDFDLAPHAQRFFERGETQLLLREIQGEVPPATYNEVVMGEGGRVLSFREKPADPKSNLACLCLYFFPGAIRARLQEYLTEGGHPDAPGYFIEWLATREPVRAHRFQGRWFDIGSLTTLEDARREFG